MLDGTPERGRESRSRETDLFWRWNLDDAKPDTFFGRDFLMADVECWLSERQLPSRVDGLGFEFGMAEIHSGTDTGIDYASFRALFHLTRCQLAIIAFAHQTAVVVRRSEST